MGQKCVYSGTSEVLDIKFSEDNVIYALYLNEIIVISAADHKVIKVRKDELLIVWCRSRMLLEDQPPLLDLLD